MTVGKSDTTSFVAHIVGREAQLGRLERAYAEHAKTFPSAWLDYGELDPLARDERLVQPCWVCGRRPELSGDGERFTAVCGCGAKAEPARVAWLAVMNWNRGPDAVSLPWRELPFFGLSDCDTEQARQRLRVMREHLELRARLVGLRRVCGDRVGRRFLQRLKAYRAWAQFGQELMKRQSSGDSGAA